MYRERPQTSQKWTICGVGPFVLWPPDVGLQAEGPMFDSFHWASL